MKAAIGFVLGLVCQLLLVLGEPTSSDSGIRTLLLDKPLFGHDERLSDSVSTEGTTEAGSQPLFASSGGPLPSGLAIAAATASVSSPPPLPASAPPSQSPLTATLRAPDVLRSPPLASPLLPEQADMQAALAEQAAQKGIVERSAAHVEAQREAKKLSKGTAMGVLDGVTHAGGAVAAGHAGTGAVNEPAGGAASAGVAHAQSELRVSGSSGSVPSLTSAKVATTSAAVGRLAELMARAGVTSLRSGGKLPAATELDTLATQGAQVDARRLPWVVPPAFLFFLDQPDGSRLLIWAGNDTLPRDVAHPRRSEVWLLCLVPAERTPLAALTQFLEHYARRGVAPERMLIVLQRQRAAAGAAAGALAGAERSGDAAGELSAVLRAWGVDARLFLGPRTDEAWLTRRLDVLRGVPVHDWVLLPEVDELFDFGDFTAPGWAAQRDVEGAGWARGEIVERVQVNGTLAPLKPRPPIWAQFPLSCEAVGVPAGANASTIAAARTKVVAHKGMWRTTADGRSIVAFDDAASYFGNKAGCPDADDVHALTPYEAFWQFYVARLMTGNPYLWEPREAVEPVRVHRFRWHEGAPALLDDAVEALEVGTCARTGAAGALDRDAAARRVEAVALRDNLRSRGGRIDVEGCSNATNPARFPLPPAVQAAALATRF